MKQIISNNKSERADGAKITKIVLMASLMQNAEAQAIELQKPRRQRSFHYIIGCDGSVIQGVPEDFRAWSAMCRSVDDISISILFCTMGSTKCGITPETWKALTELCADICKRYAIEPYLGAYDLNKGSVIPYFIGADLRQNMATFLSDVKEKKKEKKTRKKGGASK